MKNQFNIDFRDQKIYLASSSKRRIDILTQIGISFKVLESNFDEKHTNEIISKKDAISYVINNAKGKAQKAADQIEKGIVIGGDSLVFYNGRIFGKPKNEKDALEMLKELVGKKHFVLTGIAVIKKDKFIKTKTAYTATAVYMRNANEYLIQKYIESGEPFDKAGGYAIQEIGGIFINKISGDYYGAVGLSITKLFLLLDKFGIRYS